MSSKRSLSLISSMEEVVDEEELRSYECKTFPCGSSHTRSHLKPEMMASSSSSAFEKSHRRRLANSSSLSASETEDVAMCLIMLSRDLNCWNGSRLESSDSFSERYCSSMAIRRKHSNSKKIVINGEPDLDLIEKSQRRRRRSRFECLTCNRRFHSYQALGGHRASHKKTRACLFAANSDHHVKLDPDSKRSRFSTKKSSHECPICFKVFASGQALGGHKRSHGASDQTRVGKPVPEMRELLDLNLPAPDEQ